MIDPILSCFRRRSTSGGQRSTPRASRRASGKSRRQAGRITHNSAAHALSQESLESRLALAISIDGFAGFVDLRDPNFIDGYAIIASDNADNVFLKQVSTAPQDLLVADNSSFLNYQHIDSIDGDSSPAGQTYRDVFITNGSRVEPGTLQPVTAASNRTQFRLGVQGFDPFRPFTGTFTYTQTDGSETTWTFANYSSPADLLNRTELRVPSSTLRIVSGPGYPIGQASTVNAGWIRPLEISYVPGTSDPVGDDIGQATVSIEWTGVVNPQRLPTLSFSGYNGFGVDSDEGFVLGGSANTLISASNSVSFALPDPFNKDSLGVIPGSLSGSISLEVADATGRFSFPIRQLPDGTVMFFQTLPIFVARTGSGGPLTGWTDVAVIETDGGADSGYILVRGRVNGNDLTLSFAESSDTFLENVEQFFPGRTEGRRFFGFTIDWERPTNVATFASLSASYLVYNQDSQPNTVTFAPGHTFTRELTVDLLTSGSSLVVDSPIDVAYENFAVREIPGDFRTPPARIGSVDFRVTNIDVNAPIYVPDRVDIGHSETGDTERLTNLDGWNFASPTFSRTYQPFRGQTATAFASVASDGKLTGAIVLTAGSGYDPVNPPIVTVAPPSQDAGAASVTAISGTVTGVSMVASGDGYTNGATVTFSRPESGFLQTINANFGGSGYTSAPYVEIVGGGGTGATATATVAGGRVTGITITNRGRDYISTPTIRLVGGGGTGASALAQLGYDTATGTAQVVNNAIVSIQVTNPGSGYLNAPTVTITGNGAARPGAGAIATAAITADIATVRVAVPGSNYLNGGNGSIDAVITSSDLFADFAVVQIPVVNGELRDDFVARITIVDGGSGYSSADPPAVTLIGGQSGTTNTATARAEVDQTGRITAIIITNPGRLYTSAPQVQIAPPRAGGSTAAAYAELGAVTYLTRGSGYTSLSNITVNVPAPPLASGTPAEFEAVVSPDGRIIGLTMTDPGSGYSTPPVITIAAPPYQRSATASATINIATGAVTSIAMTDPGFRYKTPPLVVIEPPPSGLGVPARAVATINASGILTGIQVIDGGSGYTSRPRVQIAIPTPVNHTETITVDADLRASIYEIYVGDDAGTERPKGQLKISPSVSFAQKPVNGVSARATDLYIEATTADILVEGSIRADRQTYLLNSDSFHARYAPYYFTTRSLATNLQNDSSIIEGNTVAITLGNDTPTPASGSSAFNVLDLKTQIDSLRVTAATSTPNPAGAFPYEMIIDERDGITIDAVAASSLPLSIRAGGGITMTSALATEGDLSIDSGAAFTVSSPISTTVGQLSIAANDVQVNNSVRVSSAAVSPGRTDISLFARRGNIRMVGDISAVNNVDLRQQTGVGPTGLPLVGGQIDAANARITAENINVQGGGSVSLRTSATSLSGLASTGFALRETDDIMIPSLEVPSGLVLLQADGVDRGDKGRNPIALTARLRGVTNLFVSTPNGSANVIDDTNRELVLGSGPLLFQQQGGAEAMRAAGNVTIRSLGGSIVALDAPVAAGSARTVRLATQAALPRATTYTAGTPGLSGSTLSGAGSINDQAIIRDVFGMPASTVLAVGDLVLVKNQAGTLPSQQNGIYRVTRVGGGFLGSPRWELSRDAASDTADEMAPGTLVRVLEGPDAVAGKVFRVDFDAIPTTLVERANGNQLQLPAIFPFSSLVTIDQVVSGTGIAPNSRVAFYDRSRNVVTLDVAAPSTATWVRPFSRTSNFVETELTFNFGNLMVGQPIYHEKIAPGTRVSAFDSVARRIYFNPGSVLEDALAPSVMRFGVAGKVNPALTTASTVAFDPSFIRYGQLSVGQAVYGDGISPGARITRIDPLTRSITVTPGSVPLATTVAVDGMPFDGSLWYPEFFDAAIQLDSAFNDFDDIRVGQLVSGEGFAPGARVTGIDAVNRTIGLTAGAISDPTAVTSVTFKMPESVSFGVVQGTGAGYATFSMPTVGIVPIGFTEQYVTTNIGSEDPTKALTFVVSTTGSTNAQAGSLGKMVGLFQANVTNSSLSNPDQQTSFRFWQYHPGSIRLTQELPTINRAVTIDGSLRYAGTAGVTGVSATNNPIFVDGSLITTTNRGSRVLTTTITKAAQTITAGSETVTLGASETTTGLLPGMVVVGEGIRAGTRLVRVDAGRRELTLDTQALATSTAGTLSTLTFRADNVNGFVFNTSASGATMRNLSVGGFTGGSAILVNGARNVLLDRLAVGTTPAGVRTSTEYGITLTNNARFNTVKDSRVVGASQVGIRLEAGATENRIVGTTVGSPDINNLTGIEVVAANRNFIGTDEIPPLAAPRTISARVVSDPTWTSGSVLEVSGGVSFGYSLIGLQVFDTVALSTRIRAGADPVRISAVDTLTNRIFLSGRITLPIDTPANTTLSLLVANGGQTTATDNFATGIDERLQLTLLPTSDSLPGVNIDDLFVGQTVTGANIAAGTVIAGIDRASRVVTLSQPAVGPVIGSGWGWIAFGAGARNTVQANRSGISIVTGDANRITNTTIINNTFDGVIVKGGLGTRVGSDGSQSVSGRSSAIRNSPTINDYTISSFPVTAPLTAANRVVTLPTSFPSTSLAALRPGMAVFVANDGAALPITATIASVNRQSRQITLSIAPSRTVQSAQLSFGVATITLTPSTASRLFVGQSVNAAGLPDYTSITGLRTARPAVSGNTFTPGLIVVSAPRNLAGSPADFTGIARTVLTDVVFASLGSTSNVIYGNKGFGVNVVGGDARITRNNFATGLSGEQQAANVRGNVIVYPTMRGNTPGMLTPRTFDLLDSLGNRHGVARLSVQQPNTGGGGGIRPQPPSTPKV